MPDIKYLNSNDVKIFPAANRSCKYDNQSRLMSEVNITNIIKALGPSYSFVISKNIDELPFKFVVGGYYVEIKDTDSLKSFGAKSPVFANVIIKVCKDEDISILQGTDTTAASDSDSEYTGIVFSSEPLEAESDCEAYSIQIIDHDNSGNIMIPEASLHKYNYLDYSFDVIDCGNWDDPVCESAIQEVYDNFGISDWKLA